MGIDPPNPEPPLQLIHLRDRHMTPLRRPEFPPVHQSTHGFASDSDTRRELQPVPAPASFDRSYDRW
jgi:hypothetical protein